MSGLRLDGLTVRHDGQPVVRDVSLRVGEGESLCLVGASGSGKSLVAAAAAGLLPPCMAASGTVAAAGHRMDVGDRRALRALWHGDLCLLPQEPVGALAPLLRALDQVRLAPPRPTRAEALAWLARFGLDGDAARRMPFELSGGMAQRLLASLAMRIGASVLIADEPTKGLDPARRADLIVLLQQLRDAGRALLVITHDMDVARALGGGIAVLQDGAVVEQGGTAQVLAAPRSAFAKACVAADPARWPARPAGRRGPAVAEGEALVVGHGRHRLAGPLGLTLSAGSVTGLLGPSGSGKTTLGDTLLGLLRPASGQVRWLGRRLDRRSLRDLRPRFQKLHQDPTTVFAPGCTVGDSLADAGRLPGAAAMRMLPGLLDRLGLAGGLLDRRPGALSGGELQRLALARVLLARPALLVADEPSSRLDPPVQAAALHLLRGLADTDGMAVLLITHDERVAAAMADGSVVLG